MFDILRKTYLILAPSERRRAVIVTLMMVFQAATEVSGIVSIAPFLAVLGNPDVVHTNRHIAYLYNLLGFTNPRHFLIALGIVAFLALAASSAFRGLVQYARSRFINMRRHTLSMKMLERYIREPYSYFLQHNTTQLTKAILSEVDQYITNSLSATMQLFSYGFVVVAIVILLLAVSLQLAVIVAGTLGVVYGIIFWRLNATVRHLGTERKIGNSARYQITTEILGGIKELKVLGREQVYLDAFEWPSLQFARSQTAYQTLSEMPRYFVEIGGFCALFIIVLYTLRGGADLGHALPIIGVYAFAAYRLLPAAQNIYSALTTLSYSKTSTDAIYEDVTRAVPPARQRTADCLSLGGSIDLRNLGFTYPGAAKATLSNVNISIPALAATGIVGATGAGKSTLVDLILGVLQPSEGEILIDGVALTEANIGAWQNAIGYVPQQIFLADDTVARNIAFGIAGKEVDMEAVTAAAKLAQIDGFISTELPQGYDTVIGERGVRLSGGQRQRIGIARALYHNPDVLVLDEATSALDGDTEAGIMEAIDSLAGRKTVLMIAHRRHTLRGCDRIITVEGGGAVIANSTELPDYAGQTNSTGQTMPDLNP